MKLAIDGARVQTELHKLATYSDATPVAGATAVTRVVFSPRDLEARAYLASLYAEADLKVRVDAVGNVFVRFEGSDPALPAVGTGSHTDAIPQAGMYDGTVGVIGGLEALRALKRAGFKPRRSLEVVMFTSEEPTRFGIGCLGSRLIAGTLTPDAADALRGTDGRTLLETRTAAGFTGNLANVRLPLRYYDAWVELHVEQGPLLEKVGLPIGVVAAIAGPSSYRFIIEGFGGHAGALLMAERRDALCAASEIILAVEEAAKGSGAVDTVATVGTVEVYPGAQNSVPSRVTLQLDLRDTDTARRAKVFAAIEVAIADVSVRRGVQIAVSKINADEPAVSDEKILNAIEASAAEAKLPFQRMVSRAYHDTLFISRVAPTAMIFVPSKNGASHRPDEFTTQAEIAQGVELLARTLARLAG
ncbi:MAG: M20 family metallo-hydrolase [Clostridia bacterium]|nr:M20 family metallo-hydrolase [Deltaproteobacteria bacterium]